MSEPLRPPKALADAVINFVTEYVPEAKAIWFHGSRANGTFKRGSDWDFLVVVADDIEYSRFLDFHRQGGPLDIAALAGKKVDIQSAREGEAEKWNTSVLAWAQREGCVIWSRP